MHELHSLVHRFPGTSKDSGRKDVRPGVRNKDPPEHLQEVKTSFYKVDRLKKTSQ